MGRPDHGDVAVGADDYCRRDHYNGGVAPQGAVHPWPIPFKERRERLFTAAVRDQEADQVVRADAGLALHGTVPDASPPRLLCVARSAGARGRFHHRARSEPDVRRIARAVGGVGVEGDRLADPAAADRARTGPRHHDGGCAARAAGAASALSGAEHPSRRDQSGIARKAAHNAVGRSQRRLARQHRQRARRSVGDSSPTNISTCCRSIRW